MTFGNSIFLLVLGLVIYMMTKKGGGCCGGHKHGEQENSENKPDTDFSQHHSDSNAIKVSDKDPVCGMKVTDDSIVSSHWGKTFHFCSERCRKIYDLNPNKYARV